MEILISAHERLVEALEDLETKHVAQKKFQNLEHKHSDVLKQLNQKIAGLKEEGQRMISLVTASSRRSIYKPLPVRSENSDFLLFPQKDPFGELFSEIFFQSSSELVCEIKW